MNLNTAIEQLWTIREELRELSQKEKELRTKYEELKHSLISQLNTLGISSVQTPVASISITESQVVKITDWDAFTQYIWEQNTFHLLQKRPALNALKELQTISGFTPPGIELIPITDLSMRTK